MPITETRSSFIAVLIPADNDKPVVHVEVPIKKDEELSAMTDYVRAHLANYDVERKKSMDAATERAELDAVGAQLQKMIAEQPQLKDLKVTDDMIRQVYSSNSVDNVPLLVNNKASDFRTVILYCDDQGIAKKLPLNERATSLCCAVKRPVQVLGDAFVAMAFDNDDDFIRHDFTMAELDLNRPWAQMAIKANIASGKDTATGTAAAARPSIMTGPDAARQAAAALASKAGAAALAPRGAVPGEGKVCGEGQLGCSRPAPLRCAACKTVNYCSPDHQQFDWKRHKADCKARKAAAAAGGADAAGAATTADAPAASK